MTLFFACFEGIKGSNDSGKLPTVLFGDVFLSPKNPCFVFSVVFGNFSPFFFFFGFFQIVERNDGQIMPFFQAYCEASQYKIQTRVINVNYLHLD